MELSEDVVGRTAIPKSDGGWPFKKDIAEAEIVAAWVGDAGLWVALVAPDGTTGQTLLNAVSLAPEDKE